MSQRLKCAVTSILIILLGGAAAWAAERSVPGNDLNGRSHVAENPGEGGGSPQTHCATTSSVEALPAGVLATVMVPGPAGSTDTWFEVRNYSPTQLQYAVLNGFGALGGKGVSIESAVVAAHPVGGLLRFEHPGADEVGMGPALMSFASFDSGDCACFHASIGNLDDPDYRVQVSDLVGLRIDVHFEGDLRGSGEFQRCNGAGFVRDRFHQRMSCAPGSVVAVVVE